MMASLSRVVVRCSAWIAPSSVRARWREEWLAEIDASPARATVMQMAGAPWDAFTSRWTTRGRSERESGGWSVKPGEIKHAYRSLARSPWYSLTVAGVIALTMALTTTVFAIVDGMLFKPLPYRDAGRVYGVFTAYSKVPDSRRSLGVVSQFDVDAWKEALPDATFTAFDSSGGSLSTGNEEIVPYARVDAAFFDVIGMRPAIGGFDPGDFAARAKIQPAVITRSYWIRRFGGDASVVGRTFVGNGGVGFRVAGVLPAEFVFPDSWPVDAITPLVRAQAPTRGLSLRVMARLPSTRSEPEASARLAAAAKELAAAWPPTPPRVNVSERMRLMSGHTDVAGLQPIRAALTDLWSTTSWVVFWAAMSLVLLACVNVAGLALARLQDRWRELALRRSLGARYGDLARLLLIEYTLVVGLGTVAGVLAARPILTVIVSLMSKNAQFLKAPVIDLRVLVFAALIAALCVVLITWISARAAWRSSLRAAIVEGGATTRRVRRRGFSIVSVQVALALVMAVGGALVAGSLLRVWHEEPGFDVSRTALLITRTLTPMTPAAAGEMLDELRHVPGIEHAGGVNVPVLDHAFGGRSDFDRPPGVMLTTEVESIAMTADYLPAAALAPIDGRLPSQAEFDSGAPVIVVSDIVARQYWPGQRALGQALLNSGRSFTVIGVVPDARYMSLDMEPQGAIYWPLAADPHPGFPAYMLITLAKGGRASLPDVVSGITRLCSTCRVMRARMLIDALGDSIRTRRFNAWLFSAFGLSALVIVGAGILGLVAMTTNRRTREIGIRMALGATRQGVVRQILREQVMSVAVGLASGGVIAAWAVRFVSAYLYKTQTYDARSWAAAVLALLIIALVAGLMPSLRASRIDPVRALRVE